MKRMMVWVAALAFVIGAGVILIKLNIESLMRRQIDSGMQAVIDAHAIPDSRFEVIFCGTGTPQYNPDRAQPCLGVIAGGQFLLFDAGQGAAQQLNATKAPFQNLDTVFITHLHSDHVSGLGDVLHNGWLLGRQSSVDVVGPPGIGGVMDGMLMALNDDLEERQRVLGPEYANSKAPLGLAKEVTIEGDGSVLVFEKGGVAIYAFHVSHPKWPAAYGYRVEFGGKSIVISGDTKYTPTMGTHAQGVDLLIHEVVHLGMMEMIADSLRARDGGVAPERLARISSVHTPTLEVAQTALDARAKKLVLTHLIPPIPNGSFVEAFYVEGMDEIYDGPIVVARDGMRITLID